MKRESIEKEIIDVDGHSREIVTVRDKKGKIVHKIMQPLMIRFHSKDLLQVIIGATILAIPVGFTEETWNLGESLPLFNIFAFLVLSLIFISAFVYHHYYRTTLKKHKYEFMKRVAFTYAFSFLVVALILGLIQRTPWTIDWLLAFKRVVIVTVPASMSAAVVDVLK